METPHRDRHRRIGCSATWLDQMTITSSGSTLSGLLTRVTVGTQTVARAAIPKGARFFMVPRRTARHSMRSTTPLQQLVIPLEFTVIPGHGKRTLGLGPTAQSQTPLSGPLRAPSRPTQRRHWGVGAVVEVALSSLAASPLEVPTPSHGSGAEAPPATLTLPTGDLHNKQLLAPCATCRRART